MARNTLIRDAGILKQDWTNNIQLDLAKLRLVTPIALFLLRRRIATGQSKAALLERVSSISTRNSSGFAADNENYVRCPVCLDIPVISINQK